MWPTQERDPRCVHPISTYQNIRLAAPVIGGSSLRAPSKHPAATPWLQRCGLFSRQSVSACCAGKMSAQGRHAKDEQAHYPRRAASGHHERPSVFRPQLQPNALYTLPNGSAASGLCCISALDSEPCRPSTLFQGNSLLNLALSPCILETVMFDLLTGTRYFPDKASNFVCL